MTREPIIRSMSLLLLLGCCSQVLAATKDTAAEIPQYSEAQHLGVASCASGVCHGSVSSRTATPVNQNEYVIWSRRDRHRIAYNTLLTEESKRIANNLGLKNAYEANICLDCHADNVAHDKRGEKFQIDDGIGCESCHGGSEEYISIHADPDTTRAEDLEAGLYPTDEPRARAKLCLSCHLGTSEKMASHNIMGAGHPRISFELDTFGWLQPAHYVIDKEYAEEKWAGSSVDLWAIGQVEAARQTLKLIDKRLKTNGLFPELALFDCQACHHPMSDKRWTPSSRNGLPAGTVRLNDANFVMLFAIARVVDPAIEKSLRQSLKALHQSVNKDQGISDRTQQYLSLLDKLDSQLDDARLLSKAPAFTRAVVDTFVEGRINDYVGAEQAIMAVDMLLSNSGQREAHSDWLEDAYRVLADEDRFDPRQFNSLMARYSK